VVRILLKSPILYW